MEKYKNFLKIYVIIGTLLLSTTTSGIGETSSSISTNTYVILELDLLPNYTGGSGFGLNDKGEVVGANTIHGHDATGFLYLPEDAYGLENGSHKIDPFLGSIWTYVYDINNNGFLVGTSSKQYMPMQGFLWWENKTYKLLPTLETNPGVSSCRAVNNLGYVVGWAHSINPNMHATYWDASQIYKKHDIELNNDTSIFGIDLGILKGDAQSYATDINEKNQIVGVSINTTSYVARAFFIDRSFGSPSINMVDLGFPKNATRAGAQAINDQGQIVGWSTVMESPSYFAEHAVLWEKIKGKWKAADLGTLEGDNMCRPYDINNQGVIVGDSYNISSGEKHGFIVYNNQDMIDINDLVDFQSMPEGSYIEEASAINKDGVITGMAWNGTGHYTPVLLIPTSQFQ